MTVRFYFDEHVHAALLDGLAREGIDVLTVQSDGHAGADDERIFQRARELHRVLVSNDHHMLGLAADYVRDYRQFSGLLFLKRATISQHLESLKYIAESASDEELADKVWFLPL